MYRRLVVLAVLGVLLSACAPYGGGSYYRTDVYSVDRYPAYPYGYNRGYYVAPQPRYYTPAPRYYYRPAPVPYYRPAPPVRGGWDARGPGRPYNPGWNRGWDRDHGRNDDRGHRDNHGEWRDRQNQQGDRDDRGRGRWH